MTIASDTNSSGTPSEHTLLVLTGPTGVGKTNISIRLASHFNAPIISSDSRQIYREMVIGTAAPGPEELKQATHYFIGTRSVTEEFSAGQFEIDAVALLDKLFVTHQVVMLVGGSMMYIDALCNGMDDIPAVEPEIRAYWQQQFAVHGLAFIQEALLKADPVHYQQVDLMNHKRIIHALEICSSTGKPYSSFRTGIKKQRPFRIVKIGLNRPRAELYERINQRVDQMIADGLIYEARQLYQYRHLNALNTVGYKELFAFFDGEYDLERAVELIRQNSRHYAKRQMTWFNRDKEIQWFQPGQFDDIVRAINNSHQSPLPSPLPVSNQAQNPQL
jgi:tRNA dimethylallyltransferase